MSIKRLSHLIDPATSTEAARSLDPARIAPLKRLIVTLLAEKPRTCDEMYSQYMARAEREQWPLTFELDDIRKRTSDLRLTHRVVAPTLDTRPSRKGRPATVWALTVPPDDALKIIGMSKVVPA